MLQCLHSSWKASIKWNNTITRSKFCIYFVNVFSLCIIRQVLRFVSAGKSLWSPCVVHDKQKLRITAINKGMLVRWQSSIHSKISYYKRSFNPCFVSITISNFSWWHVFYILYSYLRLIMSLINSMTCCCKLQSIKGVISIKFR